MSLEDVARVTKIQQRILERLEAGTADGLPAEVFVRGFVRSVARCLGLDETEALRRYTACSSGPIAPVVGATARAMADAMADLAPRALAASPQVLRDEVELASGSLQDLRIAEGFAVEESPAPVVAAVAKPSKKKIRGKGRNRRRRMAAGTDPTPVVMPAGSRELAACEPPSSEVAASEVVARETVASEVAASEMVASRPPSGAVDASEAVAAEVPAVVGASATIDEVDGSDETASEAASAASAADDEAEVPVTAPWLPKMPAFVASSPSWRRPPVPATARGAGSSGRISIPSLVIDDADPESAEQVLEEREAAKEVLTTAQRRSFLPPILLDREDRTARQGGLTLAVILLLIAATLTLSYLMRRPSSSGDGVTGRAAPGQLIG